MFVQSLDENCLYVTGDMALSCFLRSSLSLSLSLAYLETLINYNASHFPSFYRASSGKRLAFIILSRHFPTFIRHYGSVLSDKKIHENPK